MERASSKHGPQRDDASRERDHHGRRGRLVPRRPLYRSLHQVLPSRFDRLVLKEPSEVVGEFLRGGVAIFGL